MTSTELVKAQPGGALAVHADQLDWTPAQQAVLRQSGIDDSVTREELQGFLHLCQRTQLDPFSRQIYLIGRWDSQAQRKVYRPQTGIDGYRVVARRATAQSGGTYGYDDTLWCDESGQWRDVWLPPKSPAAAKVTVIRDGQRFAAVALFSEYAQTDNQGRPKAMWARMPAGQLAKCAEALALRKAFPHDLAGVYTAEEMEQADSIEPAANHLRAVQRGEPDPWQQPAPPQRDFVAEAQAATTLDEWRKVWADSKTAGCTDAVRKAIEAVGAALANKQPSAAEADRGEAAAAASPLPDVARHTAAAQPVEPGSEQDAEAAQAEAELRHFAAHNGLDDIEADAERALGMPLDQAPAAAIRNLLAQLNGTAAA